MNVDIAGISPAIDSCSSLIRSRAAQAFRRIPEQHKRWLDPEDVLQDSLIAALQAESTWDSANKAKFSTYLYTGLQFSLDRQYHAPLKQQKRKTTLCELDAPIKANAEDGSAKLIDQIGSSEYVPLEDTQTVESFVTLCSELSPDAALLLIKGLLCGKWSEQGRRPVDESKLMAEIKDAADCLGIDMGQMSLLHKDDKVKKAALAAVSGTIVIGLGTEVVDARILECVNCAGMLFLSDIKKDKYITATMTCLLCYNRMSKEPATKSCFGKSYDPAAIECSAQCSDRKVCADFKPIEENKMSTAVENIDIDLDGIDFSDIVSEETETVVPPVAEEKPVIKASKEKKAAKVVAEPTSDVSIPADIGRKWPFKKDSMAQEVFKLAYAGVELKDLADFVAKKSHKMDVQLWYLRRGLAGKEEKPSHTWQLDESGGILKINDVKYLG